MFGARLPQWFLVLQGLHLLTWRAAAVTKPNKHGHQNHNPQPDKRGIIHFLMMAESEVPFQNIWMRYFAEGDLHNNFEVYVHCQDYEACVRNVRRQDIFTIIPTVPSEYCTDLLSPMIALYQAAIERSNSSDARDKFVLVSHNSLPVKSFAKTQNMLLHHTLAGQAVYTRMSLNRMDCKAKASEWSVVSRKQAKFLVEKFQEPLEYNSKNCGPSNCPDEFWPIQTLLANERMRDSVQDGKMMYLRWSKANQSITASLHEELKEGNLDLLRERGPMGPAFVDKFTPQGLQELRDSDFLFVRKVSEVTHVVPRMPLAAAFDKYVFRH